MKLDAFDEDLHHRKILPYNPAYGELFFTVKQFVESALNSVELFHIGSTAIPDLRGKPMIDMAAVTTTTHLREEQKSFEALGFHRRDVWVDIDDKPYVCASVVYNDNRYNLNIHICHRGDSVHKNSLAFIDKLNSDSELRRQYEQVKDRAHFIDPVNSEVYNKQKEGFINEIYKDFR